MNTDLLERIKTAYDKKTVDTGGTYTQTSFAQDSKSALLRKIESAYNETVKRDRAEALKVVVPLPTAPKYGAFDATFSGLPEMTERAYTAAKTRFEGLSQGEFNRSTAMQEQYGSYPNYVAGLERMDTMTADELKQQIAAYKSEGKTPLKDFGGTEIGTELVYKRQGDIDKYQKQLDKVQGKVNVGQLLLGMPLRGADAVMTGFANVLDWVAGTGTKAIFGMTQEEYEGLNMPTTAFKKWMQSEADKNAAYFGKNAQRSTAASIADAVGTGAFAALPQAALAFVTAGMSLGATSATLAGTAAVETAGASLAGTVATAVKSMAKNPQYWYSFLSTAGNAYEKARGDGASDVAATAYALTNGLFNALVEVGGGGIDKLPQALRGGKYLKEWVMSAIDEGKEEVVQGVIERGLENLIYGKDNALISTTDANAIFNPVTAAKEFGMGAAVGGILSGGQVLFQSTANRQNAARNRFTLPTAAETKELSRANTQPNAETDAADGFTLPTAAENAQTRYSVSEAFKDEVQQWYNESTETERMTSHGYFPVGTTSDSLRSIGVREGKIYWRKQKIGYILNEHPEIDIETVKDIPEIVDNPVIVMKSLTRDDSIVLIGDLRAKNGSRVMASVELTPRAGGEMEAEFSLLTSAYGRTDGNIQNLLNNSEILYISEDKNRADTWLMQLRVQFPSGQPAYGSIGNISYAPDGVKIHGKTLQELGGAIERKTAGQIAADKSNRGFTLPTAAENMKLKGETNSGIQGMERGAADGTAAQQGPLSDRNSRRGAGERTGGQAGVLAEGRPHGTAEQSRAAIERQNTGRTLRLEALSGQELGVTRGTDAKRNRLIPENAWDKEMTATAERVYNETGKRVSYVLNNIQIQKNGGGAATVRAVTGESGVIIQADHMRLSIGQIADHEILHDYADENPGLLNAIEAAVVQKYGREELDGIVDIYIQNLRGIIDCPENATEYDIENYIRNIKHELFADAYAGINAFDAHAEKYRPQARQTVEERGIAGGMSRENAAATNRTTAPPTQRFAIEELSDGTKYVRADRRVIFGDDPESWCEQLEEYINGKIRKGENVQLTAEDGDVLTLTEDTAGKVSSLYDNRGRPLAGDKYERKINAGAHIDELARVSVRGDKTTADVGGRHGAKATGGWNYRTAYFQDFGGTYYKCKLSVQIGSDGHAVYNIGDMQERSYPAPNGSSTTEGGAHTQEASSEQYYSTADKNVNGLPVKERFSFDEPVEQAKKKTKPVAESLPIIAKRELRQNMLTLFSIPGGQKAELGAVIDHYADRMLKNGSLGQRDMDELFDRMYASGAMEVEADEYQQTARSSIAGRKIYVPDSVKHEFGDDWNGFRRQAFAAGVYLTNSQGDNGIDTLNMELAEELPGLFGADETDMRAVLERIVQIAEEGKAEKMSLSDYTAMLAGQNYVSENEILDHMERQMDWALRTFAEKAKLELRLRDRTGVKIEQEREKYAQSMSTQRAREAARRAQERDTRRAMAQRQKENKELRELQQRTLKQLQWLSKNSYRAPEELKAAWDDVLGDIDIYAAGAANETQWSEKHQATWKDLAQVYKTAKETDPNFLPSKELEHIVSRLDSKKIADMDLGALQDLYKAAVGLRTEFYNRNNVIDDEQKRMFAEVYTDAKNELEGATGGFESGIKGAGSKLFNDMQLTPMNLLERMADWNPNSTWYSMARQLEEGERAKRRFEVEAKRKLEDFLKEHEDWAKKADGQGKDAIWYELEVPELLELGMGDKPIFGDSVKVYMTPAQKVHMYLESKNYDNLRHMTGGRTFADRKLYSEGKRQEAFAQGKIIRLAPETVKKIVSDLTLEEQALAAALDAFYNGYATEQINRVSNILYGYDKAMGKNYAPIYTNQNYVKSEAGIYDTTAEGVGNLKGRVYSKNPSYNISAFDAFERNVKKTARFVGMAIPVRNWNTLMNWREKNNSMADVVTHKWGEQSKRFIDDLLVELQDGKDINRSTIEQAMNKALSQYISAVFGFNPSIVLKQAASFPLAAAYLDWSNLPNIAKALGVDDALIGKYTGELAYRLMGYATPETAQLKNNPTKLQQPGIMNFVFGGGAITEMDGWTVKTLWSWAENKVKKEQPELKHGTQAEIDAGQSEYYKAVAKEFEEAVSRSQPMYDVMHRSNIMRESGAITRTFTLFKTVPQQEYNMLRQTVGEAKWHKQNGSDRKTQQKANKKAGRAFMGILAGNLMIGAITFLNALLKNKGKKYRDENGKLTLDSFMEQFMKQYFSDNAGVLLFGDTASEMIGSIFAGDKWYGIETPGIEQLGTIIEGIISGGQTVVKLVQDSVEVLQTGGDWTQYMSDNSDTYLSVVDDVAEVVATYFGGLPATNVKGYLLGALQWMSPEIKTAYEDMLTKADKSGLKGLSGDALNMRLSNLLTDRIGEVNDGTVDELAALYESGYTDAVPTSQKTTLSINGEDRELNIAQQQTYKNIWSGTVRGELDTLVGSIDFREADEKTRAKMLGKLYDYATAQAKEALFDDYKPDETFQKAKTVLTAGASPAEWAAWTGKTGDMKDAEKYEALAASEYSESVKKAIAGSIMGTEMTTESGNPSQYAKMLDVVKSGLKVNDYLKLKKAEAVNSYLDCIDAGLDAKSAMSMALELNALEPEDGKKQVSDEQKWRAAIDSANGERDQKAALKLVMSEKQYEKLEMCCDYNIQPESYVRLKELLPKFDADGNGAYKNSEIEAAIDAMGHSGENVNALPKAGSEAKLTLEQQAVMWQVWTGSTSAKNNPYSTRTGQRVLDLLNSADTAEFTLPKA